MSLVGKRVQHDCGDERCSLSGVVLESKFHIIPRRSSGTWYFRWVLVEWDEVGNIPKGYVGHHPRKLIKVIGDVI